MRALRDFYFIQFYFWFRFDLFTRSRENKMLKAVTVVTVIQVWLLVGGYWWGKILFGLAPLPAGVLSTSVFGAFAVLFTCNYTVVRRGGWDQVEGRLAQCSEGVRRAWILMAGATAIAALCVLMSAAIVSKADDEAVPSHGHSAKPQAGTPTTTA